MDVSWKPNWPLTKERFKKWWNRQGLVVGTWSVSPPGGPHEEVAPPPEPASVEEFYSDAAARALRNHYYLATHCYPLDILPLASTMTGPGSLALYLGSEPGFSKETVWFKPTMAGVENPEKLDPLRFDPQCKWWKITEQLLSECVRLGRGRYITACPDLVENMDILSALRDPQTLMYDLVERPVWVMNKIDEITDAWIEAYERIYSIIRLADGSSTFDAFHIWGPGRTAKVQCDASAMFSPKMFRQFVVPALTRQCEYLDNSLYHLDGTQAICHLDHLLSIDALDAIEWTPQAGIEGGGSPRWYDLYERILEGGKSLQIIGATHDEIVPLLDRLGTDGIYILTQIDSMQQVEELQKKLASYYS